MSEPPLATVVFLSGSGRTLANLLQHRERHALPIDIRRVLSSSGSVRGVEIARGAGIDTRVVRKADHPDPLDYARAMFDPCRDVGAELVVMAGFLKHVLIPDDFEGRVINIHPSLLPAFGGQGMYGIHVHEAVVAARAEESGCTVHFVDNEYDRGPTILQKRCPVRVDDTPASLADRVFALECEALPEAIRRIAPQVRGGSSR